MSSQVLKVTNFQKKEKRNQYLKSLIEETKLNKIHLYSRNKRDTIRLSDKIRQILKNRAFFCLTEQEKQLFEIEKTIFCKCRQKSSKNMLQCCQCNNMYHISCQRLKESQVKAGQKFVCNSCAIELKTQKMQLSKEKIKVIKQEIILEKEVKEVEESKSQNSPKKASQIVQNVKNHEKTNAGQNGKENGHSASVETVKRKIKEHRESPEEKTRKKQKVQDFRLQLEQQNYYYGYSGFPQNYMMYIPQDQFIIQQMPSFKQSINQFNIQYQDQSIQQLHFAYYQ